MLMSAVEGEGRGGGARSSYRYSVNQEGHEQTTTTTKKDDDVPNPQSSGNSSGTT